ncbi:unnamed protein product [Parnassius apollo]|uniref:(apollo) hypothetical protein n=1 Tax=Parnassius apollo TaxID=110799 RepID=A0A8S3W1J8_PARAO|nr:unnamed protein product [Parnassius apollo]
MEQCKFCSICLATNVKICVLSKSYLDFYYNILESPVNSYQKPNACYECVYHLQKYQEFKQKCNTANNIISQMMKESATITKKHIQHLDRKQCNLQSKITISPTKIYNDIFQLTNSYKNGEEKFYEEIKSEVYIETSTNDVAVCSRINITDIKHETEYDNLDEDIKLAVYSLEDDNILDNGVEEIQKVNTTNQKQYKTKRRKVKTKIEDKININIAESQEDSSFSDLDNEPLAKHVSNSKFENSANSSEKQRMLSKFDANFFEGYATVVLLTPEEAKQEVLLRKESSNYKHCPFKCDLCFRGFEVQATFENHMKKHSLEFGEYKCDYCHLRFPKQRTLYKHHFSCHKRKFYCKICPYTCFCTHQAKTHISLHKGKKYPCNECGEIFSMPNSLLMHKRIKHLTECVCELCGSTFVTQKGLFFHKRLVHRQQENEAKGPRCDYCNVQFSTETAWKRHLVLSSKHKVSNGCEYCGETFANEEDLKSHSKIHSRKQINRGDVIKVPAACEMCNKWLTNRKEYKSHMSTEHPLSELAKRLDAKEKLQCVCEVCGKMFKKQCFLLYHQRKHTGERPYACTECDKTFAFPGALSTHRATHRRGNKHRCDLCGKLFGFKSALNKHVKAHLGIRPHKCSMCDKSFPNPCDVKLHIKYVHYKVPWPKRDRSKRSTMETPSVVE